MQSNNMYKELVFYLEACESGSMFQNILKTNQNIYAVSAANPSESSWGTYCSPDDAVNGKHINSCLGDLFSVNWMEDSDKAKMNVETLQQQWQTVKTETTQSQVMQWGSLAYTSEPIGDFEAGTVDGPADQKWWKKLANIGKEALKEALDVNVALSKRKNDFAVDSRDINLHYLYNLVMQNPTQENNLALQAEITHRMNVDLRFAKMFPNHIESVKNGTSPLPTDFDCYRRLIQTYQDECEAVSDYSLKYFKAFVAECEGMLSFPSASDGTIYRMKNVCSEEAKI